MEILNLKIKELTKAIFYAIVKTLTTESGISGTGSSLTGDIVGSVEENVV